MVKGRILAVDYGVKNIGLASCDEFGITVQPLKSIPNRGRGDLLIRLQLVVEQNAIHQIVVGIPLNMDGSAGEAVRRVELFMQWLRFELKLPVSGVDERLSTIEATEVWREMSDRQQRKYRSVDSLAAAFILERFLKES